MIVGTRHASPQAKPLFSTRRAEAARRRGGGVIAEAGGIIDAELVGGTGASRVATTFEEFMATRSIGPLAGHQFENLAEAQFAWRAYQAAANSRGIVIGTNAQVAAHANQDGFVVLHFIRNMVNNVVPFRGNWTWAINKAWLDGAIDAGVPVKLLATWEELLVAANALPIQGALWREFVYLVSRGVTSFLSL